MLKYVRSFLNDNGLVPFDGPSLSSGHHLAPLPTGLLAAPSLLCWPLGRTSACFAVALPFVQRGHARSFIRRVYRASAPGRPCPGFWAHRISRLVAGDMDILRGRQEIHGQTDRSLIAFWISATERNGAGTPHAPGPVRGTEAGAEGRQHACGRGARPFPAEEEVRQRPRGGAALSPFTEHGGANPQFSLSSFPALWGGLVPPSWAQMAPAPGLGFLILGLSSWKCWLQMNSCPPHSCVKWGQGLPFFSPHPRP